jgi:hypothetical protein
LWTHAVRALVVLAAALLGGCTPVLGGPQASAPAPEASEAAAQLDALTVAGPHSMSGYSRDRFPHWRRVDENCDTRDAVLKRDGTDVQATKTARSRRGPGSARTTARRTPTRT